MPRILAKVAVGVNPIGMDQWLVASPALVGFAVFVAFAFIFNEERKSRRPRLDVHSGPDDVEKRARRAF